MGAILTWAVRVFGPIALEWSVEYLLEKWREHGGEQLELAGGEEPYIWEQDDLCLPSE